MERHLRVEEKAKEALEEKAVADGTIKEAAKPANQAEWERRQEEWRVRLRNQGR